MTAAAMRTGAAAVSSAPPSDSLTHVELTHVEKRIENWIRFGRHAAERILDRCRVLPFRPNRVFAFVRWAANDYGTVISRIDIVQTIAPGEPYQTLPFVWPGGIILLKIEGWPKVERVLRHIDAIEVAGIHRSSRGLAGSLRHVHACLGVGHEPRPYTMERYRAWLKRREIEG
ncbi:hypothetical protein BUMB_04011c [Candidatus Paraburkholderia calva]|nr:hypothetical protein BUMB_04011c [Candidatus Paraburkholderia calva]